MLYSNDIYAPKQSHHAHTHTFLENSKKEATPPSKATDIYIRTHHTLGGANKNREPNTEEDEEDGLKGATQWWELCIVWVFFTHTFLIRFYKKRMNDTRPAATEQQKGTGAN